MENNKELLTILITHVTETKTITDKQYELEEINKKLKELSYEKN